MLFNVNPQFADHITLRPFQWGSNHHKQHRMLLNLEIAFSTLIMYLG